MVAHVCVLVYRSVRSYVRLSVCVCVCLCLCAVHLLTLTVNGRSKQMSIIRSLLQAAIYWDIWPLGASFRSASHYDMPITLTSLRLTGKQEALSAVHRWDFVIYYQCVNGELRMRIHHRERERERERRGGEEEVGSYRLLLPLRKSHKWSPGRTECTARKVTEWTKHCYIYIYICMKSCNSRLSIHYPPHPPCETFTSDIVQSIQPWSIRSVFDPLFISRDHVWPVATCSYVDKTKACGLQYPIGQFCRRAGHVT